MYQWYRLQETDQVNTLADAFSAIEARYNLKEDEVLDWQCIDPSSDHWEATVVTFGKRVRPYPVGVVRRVN